jgi:1-acyl-sn-glycerol-3-phosphate acyltransferase
MQNTIFNTPLVNTLARWASVTALRLAGWKVEGTTPDVDKYVLIAAPHTSNWDFPVTLMVCFALRLRVNWMGKASLFRGPMGPVMRWLGGIAVDRSRAGNLVQETIDAFARYPRLAVIVPPEGTRGKVAYWKTGFYRIAQGADVPVALGYLDFKRKAGGIGTLFKLSGELENDMRDIQAFYAGISGKHPKQFDAASIQTKGS